MQVTRLQSNAGFTGVPGAICADPIPASGQTATDAATGGDHTLTVVGGASYLVMADATGNFLFGIADVTTAANVMWMCPASHAIVINVPDGYTSLHYQCDSNGGTLRLSRLYRNPGVA